MDPKKSNPKGKRTSEQEQSTARVNLCENRHIPQCGQLMPTHGPNLQQSNEQSTPQPNDQRMSQNSKQYEVPQLKGPEAPLIASLVCGSFDRVGEHACEVRGKCN